MLTRYICLILTFSISQLFANQISITNIDGSLYSPLTDESGIALPTGVGFMTLGYFTNDTAVQQGDFSSFTSFSETKVAINGYFSNLDGLTSEYFLFSESPVTNPNVYLYITLDSSETTSQQAEAFVLKTDAKFSDDVDIHLGTDGTVLWGIRPGNGEDPHGDEDTLSTKALIPEPETYALTLGLFALLGIAYKRTMR
jgi:hypothetical protein